MHLGAEFRSEGVRLKKSTEITASLTIILNSNAFQIAMNVSLSGNEQTSTLIAHFYSYII